MAEERRLRAGFLPAQAELAATVCVAWIAFVAYACSAGGLRLSWDALNHHIYLGWTAEHPRFDRDFMPAGYQTYQYPYLYWPVYKLAMAGASARVAAAVLASVNVLAVPPVWMVARACIAGTDAAAVTMRLMSVGLAFLTGAALSMFDVTSNDLWAAIPLLWGIALAVMAVDSASRSAGAARLLAASGVLTGISVGFKLSNGPIAMLLPLLWFFVPAQMSARRRMLLVLLAGGMTLLGAVVAYGFWGWQLWKAVGNPMYPFFQSIFAHVPGPAGRPA